MRPKDLKTIQYNESSSFNIQSSLFDSLVSEGMKRLNVDLDTAKDAAEVALKSYYRNMSKSIPEEHGEILKNISAWITGGLRDGRSLQSVNNHLSNLMAGEADPEDISMVSMFLARMLQDESFVQFDQLEFEKVVEAHRIVGEYLLRPLTMTDVKWKKIV